MKIRNIIISSILFILGFLIPNKLFSNLIFILSYIIIGHKVIINSIKNILHGEIFDEFFLMTIATLGAFLIGDFKEGVAVMLFFQIGEYLEDMAIDNSRKSIVNLMDLRSDYANIQRGEKISKIKSELLKIGDIVVIKPGEKIPVDGIIIEGSSTIDTSMLTGEAIPKRVNINSEVLSGSINLNGLLTVKVTKKYKDSTAAKILELIENADSKKTHTEKFITKFSKIYTPIVTLCALLIFLIPVIFLNGDPSDWGYRALVFLVISCPCALVISIPLGFFSGIGAASKKSIIIKGSNDLETLTKINTIIFDKTGTITEGVFEVTKIVPINIKKDELLKLCAHAEYFSTHPIAISILNTYKKDIDKSIIKDFKEISGKGIKAKIGKDNIIVGNAKILAENNIELPKTDEIGTTVYIIKNNIIAGYIVITDKIKKNVPSMIKQLHSLSIDDLNVLSGDNQNIVHNVCKKLNIKNYYYELLPQEKVDILNSLKSTNKNVLAIGDGINDAPLLINADIGVSMGNIGSDAAIEASDIIIMEDDPSKIVTAIKIAQKTKKIVWFNILFAIIVKLVILILGALGISSIWAAVFADVGVTLIAILNSIRILKMKF